MLLLYLFSMYLKAEFDLEFDNGTYAGMTSNNISKTLITLGNIFRICFFTNDRNGLGQRLRFVIFICPISFP